MFDDSLEFNSVYILKLANLVIELSVRVSEIVSLVSDLVLGSLVTSILVLPTSTATSTSSLPVLVILVRLLSLNLTIIFEIARRLSDPLTIVTRFDVEVVVVGKGQILTRLSALPALCFLESHNRLLEQRLFFLRLVDNPSSFTVI